MTNSLSTVERRNDKLLGQKKLLLNIKKRGQQLLEHKKLLLNIEKEANNYWSKRNRCGIFKNKCSSILKQFNIFNSLLLVSYFLILYIFIRWLYLILFIYLFTRPIWTYYTNKIILKNIVCVKDVLEVYVCRVFVIKHLHGYDVLNCMYVG